MEHPLRKLLLFLIVLLGAMIICALIPWQVPAPKPDPTPVPFVTITPVRIDPTATGFIPATDIPPATVTAIALATATATTAPTATATSLSPTATFTPTVAVVNSRSLAPLPGMPDYLPAFPHMDLGCGWMGAAGQVIGAQGQGLNGLVVVVSGSANGQRVEGMALTGSAETYGPGGFEIDLSSYRTQGGAGVEMQVFDLQGQPLSVPLGFALPSTCAENLALISFAATE